MNIEILDSIQSEISAWFSGYKIKKVSNHLNRVEIGQTKSLSSYKTFLGFKYEKKYDVVPIEISFNEELTFKRSCYGRVYDSYEVHCAIDESRNTVYWKAFKSE